MNYKDIAKILTHSLIRRIVRTQIVTLFAMLFQEKKPLHWPSGLSVRQWSGRPGYSIQGRVIPKTLKMVLDTSLLNTQQYKVCIKGKVE